MAPHAIDLQQQVDWLLQPLDAAIQERYYGKLLRAGLRIQYDGDDGRGKRLVAGKDLVAGEVIFREPPVVAAQHTGNKADALVCAQCFRFVGSIEQQLQHRLLGDAVDSSAGTAHAANPQGAPAAAWQSCGHATEPTEYSSEHLGGHTSHRAARAKAAHTGDEVDAKAGADAAAPEASARKSLAEASCAAGPSEERGQEAEAADLAALDASLRLVVSGGRLPLSDGFQLPAAMPCRGGCWEDVYCSAACNEAAWAEHHRLLCLDGSSDDEVHVEALQQFKEHADGSNDIFHVAARAIAGACLCTQQLLGPGWLDATAEAQWTALQQAWVPLGCGWKAAWWDAVAVPDDVDDEAAFRQELKDLAAESLGILSAALPRQAAAMPALFSLPVYGALIGMFELNNLGVVVASPVEDYFLQLDGLPEPDRSAAMAIARPLLDALGEGYDAHADGTGFFALQSCANHSCEPNAHTLKGEQDVTGDAVVTATAAIPAGAEITISYIDVAQPLKHRQAALADYGFSCRCPRCLREAASSRSGSAPDGGKGSRKRAAAAEASVAG